MRGHAGEEDLELYVQRRLDGNGRDEMEEHLLWCERCRERLVEIEAFIKCLRLAVRREPRLEGVLPRLGFLQPAFRLAPAYAIGLAMLALTIGIEWQVQFRAGNVEPQAIRLSAERGSPGTRIHPTIQPIRLLLEEPSALTGSTYRIQVVGQSGGRIWEGLAVAAGGEVQVELHQTLTPGCYFVRLLNPDGSRRREYQLQVRR